jgi:hypothetical protein
MGSKFPRTCVSIGTAVLAAAFGAAALADEPEPPDLTGVWSGPTQMLDDAAWGFEDYACFLGCPAATYAYARAVFSDPGNFERSYPELQGAVLRRRAGDIMSDLTAAALDRGRAFDPAEDPAVRCEPYGLVRQALSPLPIEIMQSSDAVSVRYELWGARRTIAFEDRGGASENPTRLGRSIGRYEGDALVVETMAIRADVVAADARALHSDSLRTIERYWLTEDGHRLNLELTLIDPDTFVEPLTLRTAWRRTPAMQLLPYECKLIGDLP